jgi:hypothetical protein
MFLFPELTLTELKSSAKDFVTKLQKEAIPDLFGVTDGKAVGTYVEQMFRRYLQRFAEVLTLREYGNRKTPSRPRVQPFREPL